MGMTSTQPLRTALVANAVFSSLSAGLLMFWPSVVEQWLGVSSTLVFQGVGLGLLVFSLDLFHQATRSRLATWRALYASALDFSWVVGTIALLIMFPNVLSSMGNALVVGVAVAVFGFGAVQIWGIGQAHKVKGSGLYRHCILVAVNAPADAMWGVISRLGDIKKYMPTLRDSQVLDEKEPGVGAVRACENRSGKRWAEECTAFVDGRRFDVRFLSEAADFPFPATVMKGGWEVIPKANGSEVMVWWELEPRPKFLATILLPLLALQVDRDFPKVVRRMADEAQGQVPDLAGRREPDGLMARMLPSNC